MSGTGRAAAAALVVTGGFAAAVAPAAVAHDALVSSNPAANSVVSAMPDDLALTFSAPVLSKPAAPQVTVTGEDGRHYETTCASARDGVVSAPVKLGGPGSYAVQWRVVSSDGHPVSGSYVFTYTGSDTGARGRAAALTCSGADASSSAPPPGASTSSSRSAEASASTSASQGAADPGASSAPLVTAAVAGVVALAAVVMMLVRSRRAGDRSREGADAERE